MQLPKSTCLVSESMHFVLFVDLHTYVAAVKKNNLAVHTVVCEVR
jgi:hypothetical protein